MNMVNLLLEHVIEKTRTFLLSLPIPAIDISVLDIVIVAVVGFYAYEGYVIGVVAALIDLASFILAFLLALKGYSFVSSFLVSFFSLPQGAANAIGFFLLALAAEILVNIALRNLIRNVPSFPSERSVSQFFRKVSHVFGIVPGVLSALIILSFILTVVISLPTSPILKQAVTNSYLGSRLVTNTVVFEKRLNDIFGGAIHDTINFLTIEPQSNESLNLHFTVVNPTLDLKSEEAMLHIVNQERMKVGLPPLAMDNSLRFLARAYATDMLKRGYFSHYNLEGQSPFDRMEQAGITYLSAGENLALAPSVELAMQGLMNSPGHRANLLSPDYHKVGIGVMDGGIYGKMFVQEFTE